MNQSENLVNLLEKKSIVKVCGAYDAMSAKLVEANGFDAIWAGSFAISAIHNVPDASILTMTEFFDAASNIICLGAFLDNSNISSSVISFNSPILWIISKSNCNLLNISKSNTVYLIL